ncbi:MAG: glycosyltransferase family 4 protein, partial [Desulfobulbaceae bacterium]|nr:glycosyltransferase family 4 protein [Desulfobulbaceae bacterium]
MKILVLSFYFEPDLCAGSFRTTALVRELVKVLPVGSQVDVVTTLPNRYRTFSAEAPQTEYRPRVTIRRIALPEHRSGMLDQSKAFFVFSRQVLKHVAASGDYDVVFATSSRLMTAVLGSWIARKKTALLYLDIRDIFVDTIKDVLPWYFALFAKPVFSFLERWAVQGAAKVNLVSEGFLGYFNSRYSGRNFSCFMNGIDDEFITASRGAATREKKTKWPVTVVYAGNIGEGQGLHTTLPALAKRMREKVCFKIIGDGGRREALSAALATAGVDNVELLEPVKRDQLIKAYQDADVLFLHLNDYDAFKKVL